jgi:regulator of nucleoside diphosphate kinase
MRALHGLSWRPRLGSRLETAEALPAPETFSAIDAALAQRFAPAMASFARKPTFAPEEILMDAIMYEAALDPRAAPAIIIGNRDLRRLRSIVERHAGGVDGAEVERLQAQLSHAIIVPQWHLPSDVVALDSTVVIEDLTAGRRRDVVLVEPEDANAPRGLISVLAPVGIAILGAAEGETVLVEKPQGETSDLRIRTVLPPGHGAA